MKRIAAPWARHQARSGSCDALLKLVRRPSSGPPSQEPIARWRLHDGGAASSTPDPAGRGGRRAPGPDRVEAFPRVLARGALTSSISPRMTAPSGRSLSTKSQDDLRCAHGDRQCVRQGKEARCRCGAGVRRSGAVRRPQPPRHRRRHDPGRTSSGRLGSRPDAMTPGVSSPHLLQRGHAQRRHYVAARSWAHPGSPDSAPLLTGQFDGWRERK